MKKWKVIVMTSMLLCLISFNCLAVNVTIHRDNYGVPHIYASSLEGLFYGFGYATAQDRLFQLEMLKRTYYGQVSEMFGADFLGWDVYFRREYPTIDELKVAFQNLDPESQIIMRSYAEGINAWVAEVLKDQDKKLPYEFSELGILPQPWSEVDMAAAVMANLALFMDLTNEQIHPEVYSELINRLGEEKGKSVFNDIAWGIDSDAYTTIQKGATSGETKKNPPSAKNDKTAAVNVKGMPPANEPIFIKDRLISQLLTAMGMEVPEKIQQGASSSASYAVAIAPEKSATGHALLMGGPQVEHWTPNMIYEVGLHGAGFDVEGTTLIGGPFLMFGESRTTAFTCTAGAGNIVDLFEEKINPENPHQYWYNGKWREMEVRKDKINVKNETDPRQYEFLRTVHGPVVYTFDTDGDGKVDAAYAKKTSCWDTYLSAIPAYSDFVRAETPEAAIEAGKKFDLSFNFVYADNKGNIAYTYTGKYPIRAKGIDERFPTPGTGEYDWQGYYPKEDNPSIINPASGIIVSWNNKPSEDFFNGDLQSVFTWGCFGIDHRAKTLANAVEKRVPVDVKDLKAVIREICDTQLDAVAAKGYLVEALSGLTDAQFVQVKDVLTSWNNLRRDDNKDGFYDSPGLTIFKEWWVTVNRNTFKDEFSNYWDIWYNDGGFLANYSGYSFFIRTIQGDKAAVPVQNDYYNGVGWKKVFADSLKEALANLTSKYATDDMTKWLTPVRMVPLPATHITGIPAGLGSVHSIPYIDRGSENHIVDLTWPVVTGEDICPPGQSGFINKNGEMDPHFADQLDMYENWQFKKMLMDKAEVLTNVESTQILIYNPEKNNNDSKSKK